MKKCSVCMMLQDYSMFNKSKATVDKYQNTCRKCAIIRNRSTVGKLRSLYNHQRNVSIKRGHVQPDYTFDEWCSWCVANGYYTIHDEWVVNNYANALAPSGDRIDPQEPYTLSNLRLGTWYDNQQAAHMYLKRPVIQRTLDGEYIKMYDSAGDGATVNVNCSATNISNCCCGGINHTVGGYVWHYADTPYVHKVLRTINRSVIKQCDKDMNYINNFDTPKQAAEHIIQEQPTSSIKDVSSNIVKCCKGNVKSAYGYVWRYTNT